MSFSKRVIKLDFELGTGSFGETGSNKVVLSGLKTQATITQSNGPFMGNAEVLVYGLAQTVYNQLVGLNYPTKKALAVFERKNKLTISAGSEGSELEIVFIGTILHSVMDFNNTPDSVLYLLMMPAAHERVKSAEPTSYKNRVDAAVVMKTLAGKAGFGFENNDVSVILPKSYYSGSIMDQIESVRVQADINAIVENDTLAIWPKNGARTTHPIIKISPENGLVGYPTYSSSAGLRFRTLFNSNLRINNRVEISGVEAAMGIANGDWVAHNIVHTLETETQGGQWFTEFTGLNFSNG